MDVFEDNDGLSVSIDIAQNKGLNQLAWVQDVAAPLHKLPQNNEICEYKPFCWMLVYLLLCQNCKFIFENTGQLPLLYFLYNTHNFVCSCS